MNRLNGVRVGAGWRLIDRIIYDPNKLYREIRWIESIPEPLGLKSLTKNSIVYTEIEETHEICKYHVVRDETMLLFFECVWHSV